MHTGTIGMLNLLQSLSAPLSSMLQAYMIRGSEFRV